MRLTPDRAVLRQNGGAKPIAIAEFMKLAVDHQVELLLRGEIEFFAGEHPVRTLDALRMLREMHIRG